MTRPLFTYNKDVLLSDHIKLASKRRCKEIGLPKHTKNNKRIEINFKTFD